MYPWLTMLTAFILVSALALLVVKEKNISATTIIIFNIIIFLPVLPGKYLIGTHSFSTPVNISLADIFIIPSMLYLLMRQKRNTTMIRLPLFNYFLAFLIWMSISLYYGIYKYNLEAIKISNLISILKFCLLVVYFYTISNIVRSVEDFKIFCKAWIISESIVAVLGICGAVAFRGFGIENLFSNGFRAMGTFGNPNMFATHMVMSFFITHIYYILGGKKVIFAILCLLFPFAILMSASKGGIIGFLSAMIFFALMMPRHRVRILIVTVPIIFIFSATLLFNEKGQIYIERIIQVKDAETFSVRSRMLLWGSALSVWQKSPILGIGKGNFGAVSGVSENRLSLLDRRSRIIATQDAENYENSGTVYVHSTYLSLLCETGIIGFILFSLIIFKIFQKLKNNIILKKMESKSNKILVCLGASMVGVFVQGAVMNIENIRAMWAIAAIIFAFSDFLKQLVGVKIAD